MSDTERLQSALQFATEKHKGQMRIGGDEYINDDGKLPMVNGRKWYEADFDYYGGFRNDCRILYSNDGLIFVSYDHYQTFYEITN